MDRWRAAGALLALAACIASSAAAPTASNQTALDLYEGVAEGCYYNFQHYGEGDRIMTNEPCLNCTCHNRMLMCYLRVCPFTKAIGQDCTVEKRADQCCPIVTCPDVPVDLLTSTSTTSPAEYGATGLGKLDKYGCSINGKYFPEGSKVPPTPNKPCEHCYCIRNMTTCVMQECTLHVDGCTPIYHKDVCCPVRYSCDHPEDEVPLLDDMSTTVRPTPGFLLTTTTVAPVTQMTQDCVHEDQIFADGALIKTEKACEHCYCMKGDIVCVVQECGAPMENEGKNCTSLPPREGQCCPDTYICEGDELSSDIPTEPTTESMIEKLTTLSPPRRAGDEGSGYRNEPDESSFTEVPTIDSEVEGSGEGQETSKPLGPDEIIPESEDGEQYMYVSTKAPVLEEHEQITEINQNLFPESEEKTDEPQQYLTTSTILPTERIEKYTTSSIPEEEILELHEHAPTTSAPEAYDRFTTELGEALNTVPDVISGEELAKPQEYSPSTTNAPLGEESGTPIKESEKVTLPPEKEQDITTSDYSVTSVHEHTTPVSIHSNEIEKEISTSAEVNVTPEITVEKDHAETDSISTTNPTTITENERTALHESEKEKESSKPEQFAPSITTSPLDDNEKLTTEPDHAENTVAVAEEDITYPHLHIPMTTIALPSIEEERTTVSSSEENIVTDKAIKDDVSEPEIQEYNPTKASAFEESQSTTTKPDKEIVKPIEIHEKTTPEPEKTTLIEETKATESSIITEQTHDVEIKTTTVSETATHLPESIITKGDQHTITTEPSFRKEDESSVSTEKPKELLSSTESSEFVDEGLIPTSAHGEKTSSDIPSIEEEFTTIVPEYITTQSTLETSDGIESLSSKAPEISSEQYGEVSLSTEKTVDVTVSVGENVEATEETSRIPGEGDCLLNGITYRNNSVVPSTNNCHSGCRCASSIIKCDPIICSPPPDYMDNCQSIYDTPDSCCPTYVCDHPRETVPPQSDNQMSGTESPIPTPTIECRGDQCEISEPVKQPSELCSSGSCLSEDGHKPHIECSAEGCGELAQPEPSLPSVEEECNGGECKPEMLPQSHIPVSPVIPCEGQHCETIDETTQSLSPQLCKNEEDCKSLEIPTIQATPCEGESCKKIDCGDSGCVSDVVHLDSHPVQCNEEGCIPTIQDCTGDEPCRRKETSPAENKPTECEGPNCKHESVPSEVQNVDNLSTVLPFIETTENTIVPTLEEKATELPDSHISTEGKLEEATIKESETDTYTTESQIKTTAADEKEEPSLIDDRLSGKPTIHGEQITEISIVVDKNDEEQPTIDSETTDKPAEFETDVTNSPNIIEEETDRPDVLVDDGEKPVEVADKTTEKPDFVEFSTEEPVFVEDKEKEKPTVTEKESTETPDANKVQATELPTVTGEATEKLGTIDDEKDINKPVDEEAKEKPDLVDEKDIKEPVIVEEEGTTKASTFDGETTDKPAIVEQDGTEVPTTVEEIDTEKPTFTSDKGKEKPTDVDEVGTEKPAIVQEGADIPAMDSDDGKDKPTATGEKDIDTDELSAGEDLTEEPIIDITTEKFIEREGTEKPAVISEHGEETPSVIDDKVSEKPGIVEEDRTIKPVEINNRDEESLTSGELVTTKEPIVIKDTDKPVVDEEDKEKPAESGVDHSQIPVGGKVEKEKPVVEEDIITTPGLADREMTEHPVLIDEEMPETPTLTVEESSVKPDLIDEEKSSESPSLLTEEGTEEPTITEEQETEEPVVGEDAKDKLDAEKEGTKKPLIIGEEGTEKPIMIDEEIKEQPAVLDNEGNVIEEEIKTTTISEDEDKTKLSIPEEEKTDKPAIIEEGTTNEPATVEKEDTTSIDEEYTEKPSLIDETGHKPTKIDEDGIKETTVLGYEGTKRPFAFEKVTTDEPTIDEMNTKEPEYIEKESTDMPTTTMEEGTEKPLIDEEGKLTPSIDRDDMDKPVSVGEGTVKPMVDEGGKEKPTVVDEDMREKPEKSEGEEGSTFIPEEHTSEPDKELKVPEILAQTTEATMSELEKITKTPVYESETTSVKDVEYAYSTELNTAEPIEISTPQQEILPSETPVVKVTEAEDSDTPEIVTESIGEPEIITKTPSFATIPGEVVTSLPEKELVTVTSISDLDVQTTSSAVDTTDIKEAGVTSGQYEIIDEGMQSTESPQSHETIEKATESGLVGEQEVPLTDASELETPTTKAPGVVLKEPEEGVIPDRPDLPVTGETEEESTTKTYDQEKINPVPESHVTEVTSSRPEQPDITVSELPEIKDKDKFEPETVDEHIIEPEKVATQLPEEEIKIDHSESYSPDKEAITTETPVYTVTEPVRRFTEIEDPSLTGQTDIVTGYPEKPTEHHIPYATEKIDEYLDITPTSSEQPLFTDMESPKLPEEISEFNKPETTATDKEILESSATEIPISVVTEISHTSEKDITNYEEKFTTSPEISEGYDTQKQETGTEIPQYHSTILQEHSEATQSYTTEQYTIETQEVSTKPGEKEDIHTVTTDVPKTSVKEEELETKAPEIIYTEPHDENKPSVTEIEKQSTELPSHEDVLTETPSIHVTSEIPQSLVTEYQESTVTKEELTPKPELITTQSEEIMNATELYIPEQEEQTKIPIHETDSVELSTKATKPDVTEEDVKTTIVPQDAVTEKQATTLAQEITEFPEFPESDTKVPQVTTDKQIDEDIKPTEYASSQSEFSETTPYLIELEEHTHKIVDDISTIAPSEGEHTYKPVEDISTLGPSVEEHTHKIEEYPSTALPLEEKSSTMHPEAGQEPQISEFTTKATGEDIGTTTKEADDTSKPSAESLPEYVSEKNSESLPEESTTQAAVHDIENRYPIVDKEQTTFAPIQINEESTSTDSEKIPISEASDVVVPTEKEITSSEKPLHPIVPHETISPEDESIASTTKTTTVKPEEEEILTPVSDDKLTKPDGIPTKTSEVPASTTTTEASKPSGVSDVQPTDEIPAPEEEGHFPPSGSSGYGEPEPDYVEEDQAFGPGTCRYGGKVYVSAQQIPRDDPCDFCFCFRSDIICLQQSCPPPIHGCHEEPIQGFCCPRYECPVSMATTVNVTTTTTTTTTTLPPHFPTHSYKGAAQRRGCQIKGHSYKVGEVVRSSSGPCLHCTCGGDGQMKCDPKACTPEPMLRQMIAAAVSAKRRR